jgi:hypothetical protein
VAGPSGSGAPVPLAGLPLVRADDLLDLQLRFVNLQLEQRPGGAVLTRVNPAAETLLIVELPPQHVAEQAFDQPAGVPAPDPPVPAEPAGPSRLVFRLTGETQQLPVTPEALLSWRPMMPMLAPAAQPVPSTEAVPPAPTATAIELPARLVLSPGADSRWTHATGPVTRAGRTELWHTRLATRIGPGIPIDESERGRPVWPIWTAELDSLPSTITTSLSAQDRLDIVRLSSGVGGPPGRERQPAQARQLMLTALGGWLDLAGVWALPATGPDLATIQTSPTETAERIEEIIGSNPGSFDSDAQALAFAIEIMLPDTVGLSLQQVIDRGAAEQELLQNLVALFRLGAQRPDVAEALRVRFGTDRLPVTPRPTFEWMHRAVQGRDVLAQVSRPGHLFPLGHRVDLVTLTERVLATGSDGRPAGILRRASYLVVNEAVRDYGALAGAYRHGGRESPFVAARLLDLRSPRLSTAPPANELFWPKVGGTDFRWSVVLTDREGRPVDVSMPLLFVPAVNTGLRPFDETLAADEYARHLDRRTVDIGGRDVAYTAGRPGETALATQSVVFGGAAGPDVPGPVPAAQPRFLPVLASAQVRIPAVDALLGPVRATPGVAMTFADRYLQAGFDPVANRGQLFAQLTRVPLSFPAERAGGLARPDAAIEALSRVLGPVGDPANMVDGVFDVDEYLPDAKLLGGLSLRDLVDSVREGFDPLQLPDLSGLAERQLWERLRDPAVELPVPGLTTRTLRNTDNVPTAIETHFVWKPRLRAELPPALDFLKLGDGARLVLTSRLLAPLDGTAPTFDSQGELTGFAIELGGVVLVSVGRLAFRARTGRKMDVSAEGVRVVFLGDLDFLNTIRDLIPVDGFSDPPAVTVTPDGVSATYSLGLPRLQIGVFGLDNVGLSAALTLPFLDRSISFRFALAERHDPFLVSVSLFGGGGFFALTVHTGQPAEVEASIEFGGNLSLDIVVASGGVYVMAGVYLRMSGGEAELTGYLRAGGSLCVLGLITVSVEFYLALTYDSRAGKVWGEASLTVSVEVLFFSASVTLPVRREFGTRGGDPTFDELVEPADWAEYCGAFAPLGGVS